MMELSSSENLLKSSCLITSNSSLLFWSSLIWLYSEPLAVNIANSILFLPVTSDSLYQFLPTKIQIFRVGTFTSFGIIKVFLFWSLCLLKDGLIKYVNYCVVYLWRLWGIILPHRAACFVSWLWLWWFGCGVWMRLRVKGWELVLQGQHFIVFCLNLGLKIWDLLLMHVN